MKKIILISVFCLFNNFFLFAQNQTEWHFISNSQFQAINNNAGAIYPVNEDLIFAVADGGRFYKSMNGGANWTEYNANIPEDFYDLVFLNETKGFAVGSNGTLMKTINGGETWTNIELNSNNKLLAITNSSPENLFIVGENGFFIKSNDGGDNWSQGISLTTEVLEDIKFKNETTGFISGTNGELFKTEDAGATWQVIDVGISEDLFSLNVIGNSIYMLAGSAGSFSQGNYFPHFSAYEFLKSTDAGQTWVNNDLENYNGLITSDLCFTGNEYGIINSSELALCSCCWNEVQVSLDEGESWGVEYYSEYSGYYCNFNTHYSYISFVENTTIAYILSGEHIFTNAETSNASTEDFRKELSILLYPNPVTQHSFTIETKNLDLDQVSFQLIDFKGKEVKHLNPNEKTDHFVFNVPSVEAGVYFLKSTSSEGSVQVNKVIIK